MKSPNLEIFVFSTPVDFGRFRPKIQEAILVLDDQNFAPTQNLWNDPGEAQKSVADAEGRFLAGPPLRILIWGRLRSKF